MCQSKIESKIKGALYGFAIGDAMGATTEFRDKKYIEEHYGVVCDIIGGGVFNLPPGFGTDDTAMTLCVCEAIDYGNRTNSPDLKQEAILNRCCYNFVKWLTIDGLGCGRCCYESIVSNAKSYDYHKWVNNNEEPIDIQDEKRRLGNGSLMRTLPIVLAGLSEETAILQSRLTHNNAVCDYAIKYYHKNIISLLEHNEFYSIEEELFEPSGHVINTLSNSLYWAQNSSSLEEAIINAVNHGGDADTIAAITGSLVGALYGYEAIPTRWVEQLKADTKQKLDRYVNIFAQMYVRTNRNIV